MDYSRRDLCWKEKSILLLKLFFYLENEYLHINCHLSRHNFYVGSIEDFSKTAFMYKYIFVVVMWK